MEDIIQFGTLDSSADIRKIIKVIGVGGGGSNAVKHMYSQGIKDVGFSVCNTDAQALYTNPVPTKIQLGKKLANGLGAGATPEVGREAAEESKEEIRQLLSDGTRMLFVTAGMGGGTGTGAAPVVAGLAKEMGILTIGIVTAPFKFEGPGKIAQAEKGIENMRKNCDAVLVILNDQIKAMYPKLGITGSFAKADDVLLIAAKSIAELITSPGNVNIDFKDVEKVLKNSGTAIMGESTASGEDRAIKATTQALRSPLLTYRNIQGAKNIIVSITYSQEHELLTEELSQICNFVQEEAGKKADVIWGTIEDNSLGEAIKVVITASGFDDANLADMDKEIKFIVVKEEQVEGEKQVESEKAKDNKTATKVEEVSATDTKELSDFMSLQTKLEVIAAAPSTNATNTPTKEPILPTAENNKEEKEAVREPMKKVVYIGQDEEKEPQYQEVPKILPKNKPKDGELAYIQGEIHKQKKVVLTPKERLIQEREARHKNPEKYILQYDIKVIADIERETAIERRGIELKTVIHSSEQNTSQFAVNKNRIVSVNSYLHDNVD
jgi:cell division protein FtsZ